MSDATRTCPFCGDDCSVDGLRSIQRYIEHLEGHAGDADGA